jgi:nitroreductase
MIARERGLEPLAELLWTGTATDADAERAAIDAVDRGELDVAIGGFAEHLDRAPALLVLMADLRLLAAIDRDHARYTFVGGASVYPFAWSILLAARAEGLGGVITTMAVGREDEVRALLGVPPEHAVAGVVVLGHPHHRPTRLTRKPVPQFATIDAFDGLPLGEP